MNGNNEKAVGAIAHGLCAGSLRQQDQKSRGQEEMSTAARQKLRQVNITWLAQGTLLLR